MTPAAPSRATLPATLRSVNTTVSVSRKAEPMQQTPAGLRFPSESTGFSVAGPRVSVPRRRPNSPAFEKSPQVTSAPMFFNVITSPRPRSPTSARSPAPLRLAPPAMAPATTTHPCRSSGSMHLPAAPALGMCSGGSSVLSSARSPPGSMTLPVASSTRASVRQRQVRLYLRHLG